MPTVLNRPHPFLIELARPPQRLQMPRLVGRDRALRADRAAAGVNRRQRMRALVNVGTEHDHRPPSLPS
jgi:hypothetical protein